MFQGNDNIELTDIAYHDYEITMPWPTVDGNTITTDNGFSIEFIEPGAVARLRYTAVDDRMSFDLIAEAVTPLLARGHVMPGEEAHHVHSRQPGGAASSSCTSPVSCGWTAPAMTSNASRRGTGPGARSGWNDAGGRFRARRSAGRPCTSGPTSSSTRSASNPPRHRSPPLGGPVRGGRSSVAPLRMGATW